MATAEINEGSVISAEEWESSFSTRKAIFKGKAKGIKDWKALDLLLRGGSFDPNRDYLHKLKINNSFLDEK